MAPDTPDAPSRNWQDKKSYEPLFESGRAEVDWAFARRHADAAHLVAQPVRETLLRPSPPIRLVTPLRRQPAGRGLRFRRAVRRRHGPCLLDGGSRSDGAGGGGQATAADDPEAFDLFSLPMSAVILRDGATEHVLLADGPRRMRLALHGDSIADGPVRLTYDRHGGFSPLRWKILLMNRLYALWRLHRFPRPLFPADPVVARRVRALQAYDAHHAGAGQKDIIIAVLGAKMADAKSFDSSRKTVKRMLELAEHRIETGRRMFLSD